MVLLWKAPVYQGRDPVNGFYVDMKEAEAPHEAWRGVNSKATEKIFMKVLHHCFPQGSFKRSSSSAVSWLTHMNFFIVLNCRLRI